MYEQSDTRPEPRATAVPAPVHTTGATNRLGRSRLAGSPMLHDTDEILAVTVTVNGPSVADADTGAEFATHNDTGTFTAANSRSGPIPITGLGIGNCAIAIAATSTSEGCSLKGLDRT